MSASAPVAQGALQLAVCPLCHTTDAITTVGALDAGGSWRCRTCHQTWSAPRLATVAAYTAWSREHEAAERVLAETQATSGFRSPKPSAA